MISRKIFSYKIRYDFKKLENIFAVKYICVQQYMTGRVNVYINNTSYLFQQNVKQTQAVEYRWIKDFSSYKTIYHIVTSIVYTFSTVLSKWRIHKKNGFAQIVVTTRNCPLPIMLSNENMFWLEGTERDKET